MGTLRKNAIYKLILNLFNVCIPLIIGPYALRKLGPVSMGNIFFSDSIFGYFFILSSFGIYQYGIREISRIRHDKNKLSQLFTNLLLISICASIITLAIYLPYVNKSYSTQMCYSILKIYSFNIIANIFYVEWAIEALEDYKFIAFKTIAVKVIYVVLLILMVTNSNDYNTYAILLVFSSFANNIISFIYITKRIPLSFKKIVIRKHLFPLATVVLLSNANTLFTQLDKYTLGEFVNKEIVSYYTLSANIIYTVYGLLTAALTITLPRLSNYIGNNNDKEYLNLLNKVSMIFFCLMFPAAVGLYVISDKAIIIYGGHEYLSAVPTLKIFCVYLISIGIEYILTNQIMYVHRKEKQLTIMSIMAGIINLIIKIALIKLKLLSTETAVISTLVSNTIFISASYWYIRVKLKINFNIISMNKIKYLFISLLFIPTSKIISLFIEGFILNTILTIVLSAVLYILVLIIIRDKVFFYFLNIGHKKKK